MSSADTVIGETFRRWLPAGKLERISPLTPDASLRRYYRVAYSDPSRGQRSAVVTVFDSIRSPEAGGQSVNSFDACVELGRFFQRHAVPVPEIFYERREPYLLISEDLGDTLLASRLPASSNGSAEGLYVSAIDVLVTLQQIAPERGFFPFQRAFLAETYEGEMKEFSEFVYGGAAPAEREAISDAMRFLGRELDSLPRTLAHRDFHSWNLMVDCAGKLRVIDYQDALMATQPYDVVALLNDRDTDLLLGEALYLKLLHRFRERSGRSSEFYAEYDRVLLQRDLKVAGRFRKLVKTRGLAQYERWVPGTLRRIGRTLERLSPEARAYEALLAVLAPKLAEVEAGANTPLRIAP